jgi:hypothetical protein
MVGCNIHDAGIWRNLEVAVKTVMFSDRTGSAGAPNGNNKNSPKKRAIMEAAVGAWGGGWGPRTVFRSKESPFSAKICIIKGQGRGACRVEAACPAPVTL